MIYLPDKSENIDGEIWKGIRGYEDMYAVSNMGRIKSLDKILPHRIHGTWHIKERILRPAPNGPKGSKYLSVSLNVGRGVLVSLRVHRAVAEAFVDNPDGKTQVNHIDGNKFNNRADNLEWVTPQENSNHAWRTGLCENIVKRKSVPVVCVETGTTYTSLAEAGRSVGVTSAAIGNAIKHNYASANCHWKYANTITQESGEQ